MMLSELYPGSDSHPSAPGGIDLDVVFVHGLSGNYIDTWKAADETVWPKDLLPGKLARSKIRVLSFDYGGSIKSTSSTAGMDDAAQNLLGHLIDKRIDPRTKYRPIVFVSHSLGGVILKRAIRIAYNNTFAFKSIQDATLGVVFFATPHHGSRDEFSSFLSHVLRCSGPRRKMLSNLITIQPTTGMLKEIQRTPELFDLISKDFVPLYENLSLHVFLESTITTSLGHVVVNSHQGTTNYSKERVGKIPGDHLSLCKFSRGQGEELCFRWICNGIEEMLDISPRQKGIMEERRRILDMLCSDSLCQSMMVKRPMEGTGKWILDRDEYKTWLDEKSSNSMLWISGAPGCGKSYLARRIVDSLAEMRKFVVCAFLRKPFPINIDAWNLMLDTLQQALKIEPKLHHKLSHQKGTDGVQTLLSKATRQIQGAKPQPGTRPHPTENNLQGLLATIIRQVLSRKPGLINEVMEGQRPRKPNTGWELGDMKALWRKAMDMASAQGPIMVVVDGFDEMERNCQRSFLATLAEFRRKSNAPHNLRLLLFSNEYPDLQLDSVGFGRYAIGTMETTEDIKLGAQHRMKILDRLHEYTPEVRNKIIVEVPKAANGTYLRADLMLGSLKRTNYDNDGLDDLFSSSSNSTAELYDHLLRNIWADDRNRTSVKHVLLWVMFQQEGLNPAELNLALALTKVMDNARRKEISYDQVREHLDENTELWVNRFCGHLIKLENGRFELVHPSLKNYLTTKPDQLHKQYGERAELPYHGEFFMDPSESHARLGDLCATYLALPFFAQSVRSRNNTWLLWQAAVNERMGEHKFLRYAALYWSKHLKLAQDLAIPGSKMAEMTVNRRRQHTLKNTESWAEIGCYFHDWHEQDYPNLCSVKEKILHILPLELHSIEEHRPYISPGMRQSSTPSLNTSQPGTSETRNPVSSGEEKPRPTLQRVVVSESRTASTRRAHWIVRGAQNIVDILKLDNPEPPRG
ncbi:hypothetical protein GGR51DRAFT_341685 [Nemania sp. FL0031]|nr:hypothetical protein GGR51DRAFT_341685 [Nemania sp. FL0031]